MIEPECMKSTYKDWEWVAPVDKQMMEIRIFGMKKH